MPMRQGRIKPLRQVRRESGLALLALVALVALMSAYYIIGSLNRTSSEVVAERNRTNIQVLQEAKSALIAYAASQAWDWTSGSGQTDQPGALPCPATDTSGNAGASCSSNSSRIGRLPWKKIGAGELHDASGETLWYGLSTNFRKLSGTTVINSDTQGTLTITGSTPASNVVAVIIAPGVALGGQSRTSSGVASNTITDFLESVNTGGSELAFSTASSSDTFNDQLITITQADLMAAVEPSVIARIEQDIKPSLQNYYAQWGRLPYPSSFTGGPGTPGTTTTPTTASDRLESAYVGSASMTAGRGLLPITSSVTYPWVAGSGAVALNGGTATGVTGTTCASVSSPTSGWKCNFSIVPKDAGSFYWLVDTCKNAANGTRYRYCIAYPAFSVVGDVSNAGLSIAKISPTTATDVTVTNTSGSTARPMSSKAISWALKTDGKATFTFQGTYNYTSYSNTSIANRAMAVTIPDRVTVDPMTNSADTTAGWFIRNEWYRQLYYVVSPGYLPGAAGSCSPSCLSVSGLATSNNLAIVILAGHTLNNTTRPSATLANYLEGNNATPGGSNGYTYAHNIGISSSANDRVLVVAP
jgi:hypothetical protein